MPDIVLSILVVIGALGLSAGVGYPLTVGVLRWADREPRGTAAEDADDEERTAQDAAQVLRGGTWIGILERLAITLAILTSYPAAIAVVIAVKGLGRFPELRVAHGVSERFIIGTLCSGLWAAAVGVAAVGALEAIG